jgi:hypothetical protein
LTGQGLGFVDLVRASALAAVAAGAAGADPDCRGAIAGIAKRAPRLVLGYDDFTAHRFGFGMVLELAPDLLADVRRLSSSLAGYDRLIGQKPAMAFAVAVNIEHGRTMLSRVAGALRELGQRCKGPSLVEAADKLASTASRPLPPVVAGLRGGFAVVDNLKMGAHGPESIDGFAVIQLDHTAEILKLASGQVPGLELRPDGKAHALPAMIPFPGHVAASETAIGVGLGQNSATAAVEVLKGTEAPTPTTCATSLLRSDWR